MKMTKEEKELRKLVGLPIDVDDSLDDRVADARKAGRLITAFRRAVIEECAKVAEATCEKSQRVDPITMKKWMKTCVTAAAIRKGGKG